MPWIFTNNVMSRSYLMRIPLFWKKSKSVGDSLCSVSAQIEAWRKANRKMRWQISEKEFEMISTPRLFRCPADVLQRRHPGVGYRQYRPQLPAVRHSNLAFLDRWMLAQVQPHGSAGQLTP
jgi:hypothetical protein